MAPIFRFMTGFAQYRIEAADRAEAIRIAFDELQPTEEAKAIILSTMYDEDEARQYVSSSAPGEPGAPEDSPDNASEIGD